MTDKEVGELWRDLGKQDGADLRGQLYKETLIKLIHKLVEERARFYGLVEDYTDSALRDFGIPEKEYNDGKYNDKV